MGSGCTFDVFRGDTFGETVASVSTVVTAARPEEVREVSMLESWSFLGRNGGAITPETGRWGEGKR